MTIPTVTGVSLVVPALNEEVLLAEAVGSQRRKLALLEIPFEIIVVDDGSRDRTPAIAHELAAAYPEVSVVSFPANQGVGAAIWAGYQRARHEWVFANAADEPFDLVDLPRVLEGADRADVIVVARHDRRANSLLRRVTSLVNYVLIRVMFGTRVLDFQFVQLYRRSVLEGVRPIARDTFMPPELLLRVLRRGARMIQVRATFHRRTVGSSRYNDPRRYARTLFEMMRFWWELHRPAPRSESGRGRAET